MKIFIKDTTWEIVGVTQDIYTEPENEVSKSKTFRFTVTKSHYENLSTWDDSFLESSGNLKRVCVTANNKTAADLNSSFDGVNKLFYGLVVAIDHFEDYVVFTCEDMIARWLREPIDEDDNIAETSLTVATLTSNSEEE